MNQLIIPLKGRNKERLNGKLIKFQNKIYKYRNNELIYIQPDNKKIYYDFTYGKKTNKFYPITAARHAKIQKYRGTNKEQQDFFEFVKKLKAHPHLSTLRNGIHFSEKEQKLLKTYFANNMSLKETAKQLYLHKNTLQYQLDKIWKTTGYNPRNFKDATVLYVGLKLLING